MANCLLDILVFKACSHFKLSVTQAELIIFLVSETDYSFYIYCLCIWLTYPSSELARYVKEASLFLTSDSSGSRSYWHGPISPIYPFVSFSDTVERRPFGPLFWIMSVISKLFFLLASISLLQPKNLILPFFPFVIVIQLCLFSFSVFCELKRSILLL